MRGRGETAWVAVEGVRLSGYPQAVGTEPFRRRTWSCPNRDRTCGSLHDLEMPFGLSMSCVVVVAVVGVGSMPLVSFAVAGEAKVVLPAPGACLRGDSGRWSGGAGGRRRRSGRICALRISMRDELGLQLSSHCDNVSVSRSWRGRSCWRAGRSSDVGTAGGSVDVAVRIVRSGPGEQTSDAGGGEQGGPCRAIQQHTIVASFQHLHRLANTALGWLSQKQSKMAL
jgi:hypothetical protein